MHNWKETREFFHCDCGGEVLEVNYWPDEEGGMGDLRFLSIWYSYRACGKHWWNRLVKAYGALKHGDWHADSIVLTKEEAKRLGEHLLSVTEEK